MLEEKIWPGMGFLIEVLVKALMVKWFVASRKPVLTHFSSAFKCKFINKPSKQVETGLNKRVSQNGSLAQ